STSTIIRWRSRSRSIDSWAPTAWSSRTTIARPRTTSTGSISLRPGAPVTVTECVAANPVSSLEILEVAGVPSYAVAILRPESAGGTELDQYQDQNWGLAVLDLMRAHILTLVV